MKSFTLGPNLIGIVSLFASAFISFLLVPNNVEYFPSLGVSLSFLILNILIFVSIQQKSNFHKILFVFASLTSLSVVFYANGFLTFLNILASLYLISLYNLKNLNILEVIFAPLVSVLKAIVSINQYKIDKSKFHLTKQKINKNTVYPVIITVVVLALILPILASANPIFENLVTNIFKSLRLEELFENLSAWMFRFIVFVFWSFAIPRFIGLVNTPKEEVSESTSELSLLIPKTAVIFVIVAFFATQIQLYTASAEVLKNLDISNSSQTRAIFSQLSVVALIIFGLIYSDKIRKYNNKVSTYVLIIEGLFLTAIATYSDYSYISNWGLTHKRLYGIAVILWLVTAFVLFSYKYLKTQSDNKFIKNIVTLTGVIILSINFANFDFLIANFQPKNEQGIDYNYIIYNTSADGKAYDRIVDESSVGDEWYDIKMSMEQLIQLKKKYYNYVLRAGVSQKYYEEFYLQQPKISDFRQINLSEFMYVSQISNSKMDDLVTKTLKMIDALRPVETFPEVNIVNPEFESVLVTIKLKSIENMCNDKCIFVELKDSMELRSSSVFVGNYYKYLTKAGNYQIAIYQADEDWNRSILLMHTTIEVNENTTEIEI